MRSRAYWKPRENSVWPNIGRVRGNSGEYSIVEQKLFRRTEAYRLAREGRFLFCEFTEPMVKRLFGVF